MECRGRPNEEIEEIMIRSVAIVSLSRGIIGELSARFEVEIGLRRLEEYGLPRCIMPFGVEAVVDVKEQIIRFDA